MKGIVQAPEGLEEEVFGRRDGYAAGCEDKVAIFYGPRRGKKRLISEVHPDRLGPPDAIRAPPLGGYTGADAVGVYPTDGNLVYQGREYVLFRAVYEERLVRLLQRRRQVLQERAAREPGPHHHHAGASEMCFAHMFIVLRYFRPP